MASKAKKLSKSNFETTIEPLLLRCSNKTCLHPTVNRQDYIAAFISCYNNLDCLFSIEYSVERERSVSEPLIDQLIKIISSHWFQMTLNSFIFERYVHTEQKPGKIILAEMEKKFRDFLFDY